MLYAVERPARMTLAFSSVLIATQAALTEAARPVKVPFSTFTEEALAVLAIVLDFVALVKPSFSNLALACTSLSS